MTDVTLEPLDDYIVIEPLDESELPSGLIVPTNEAVNVRSGIVASVGPDVTTIEPGDKVLFPRDAGYEVRLARSSHRVRVLRREELLARIHDQGKRPQKRRNPLGGGTGIAAVTSVAGIIRGEPARRILPTTAYCGHRPEG